MSKVILVGQRIETLTPDELTPFRSWHAAFDAEVCDHQSGADVQAGKIDAFAGKAFGAHTSGH